ncbi:hypothetical protein MF672_036835 [Actinomadura sp. ATCC 31491]|uniref:DUF4254 domain-containing protein n=1 Tax=Actinomadura luzonensis TaxID=2805427 RepID=A0ABT0G436_9ACTN|nr:hypothetical protein [Actinomadura luzonensis]MCK2219322.1 hypothetical protein [Actinomadura luzonensis]
MKLDLVLKELHRAENELGHLLLRLSERHKADHETYHVARDLAVWCQDHVRLLAEAGDAYGLSLDPSPAGEPGPVERVREKAAEWLGRRPEPGLLLLADLRHLYRTASGVSLDWELLAQAAQGARRRGLLELAGRCHPQTLRQLRWAEARLKESATQVLVS